MLGNIKIRIKNPEHSAAVQNKLFEIGARWIGAAAKVGCTNSPYLYLDDGLISYGGTSEEYFLNDDNKEVFLVNGEFSEFPEDYQPLPFHQGEVIIKSPTKPPVALRPRYLANLQRMEEILEAMTRYVEAKKRIPSDWLTEFDSLNQGIPEESFEKTMGRVLKGGRL